ncbi:hypothetical protein H257_18335 [Aphanomyces astaci]|uniref:Peptidase M12A domain-containing protein n=1 Tax=Aphanomyces astaci TaxID=112090 RepID=W4FDE0_APHAT|nr:hypothetical protein H257_18335 [Aphanomyces astaci]ETV64856.1 hypothetical protein H257_18335 [Aphanomyces astaci]|eukprot:XP_009845675.1 hypothetical protein H257_18335 [Aphanomyces astaci]
MVQPTFIAMLLGAGLLAHVHAAGFFVCPGQCEAMFLPRDMDDVDDCSCSTKATIPSRALLSQGFGDDSSSYRCPKDSSAKALHPRSFDDCLCSETAPHRDDKAGQCVTEITCSGKYGLKAGVTTARSLADCDCLDPYTKDESTGECRLTHCPRAANYVIKAGVVHVHSLVDCDCLAPYTKNAQSGECYVRFECPPHASPPVQGVAKSVGDCTCDWGFVRPQVKPDNSSSNNDPYCVAENPTFACPPHARPVSATVQNFMDCECANGFHRLDKLERCVEDVDGHSPSLRGNDVASPRATDIIFTCPDFSVPLAPHPYSMTQCRCLPGFEPNLNMQTCDWTPDYFVCPPHSFNPYPALPPLDFMDCHCAKGFHRHDATGTCVAKTRIGANGCPAGALAETWPVHDPNWDCFCPHGEEYNIEEEGGAYRRTLGKEDEVPFEKSDWTLTCKHAGDDEGGVDGCPLNAVMNHWPVLGVEDCSCKAGYDSVVAPDHKLGITCNRTDGDDSMIPKCVADGMTRSPADNVCRYPAEDVGTTSATGHIVVNGNELAFVLVEEDIMVTQGDIAVGTSFGYLGEGDDDLLFYMLHGYYNKEQESRWKEATMCFTINQAVRHRRDDIWSAMSHISATTGFHFLECQEDYCDDHLTDCDDVVDVIQTSSGCWSSIGRVGGRQALGVSDGCARGNLIHVLLHAVGLHHPTVRPDRDAHVQIAWECVESAKRSYLSVEERVYDVVDNVVNVPYDYFSLMHPRADVFVNMSMAGGGCMTLFPLIEDPFERQAVMTGMGQRDQLSLTDIHYVWALYPELKQAAKESLLTPEGTNHYHEARLHTKQDATPFRPVSTSGAVGAAVCVVAFVAIVGFATFEMRRVARKTKAEDERDDYSDPLLTDPIYD